MRTFVTLVTLFTPTLLGAQPAFPHDSTVRRLLHERIAAQQSVGIVVGLLAADGTRRYIRAGTMSRGGAPVDERTLFEIGSVTKTFTGLLLADMVRRGEVRLDQPVAELVPGMTIPVGTRAITLEDLATHRSGLPRLPANLTPANASDPYADYDAARLGAFLASHTLARQPGTTAAYSNLAFGLLGHALGTKSGAGYGAALTARILRPLNLRDTHLETPVAALSRTATGHTAGLDSAHAWNFDALGGAGAIRSTAVDMLTYLHAHVDAFRDSTRGALAGAMRLATAPRADLAPNARIGLAWNVRTRDGRSIWWHNGGTGGFRSMAAFDPVTRQAVVVLSNSAVSVDELAMHLLDPSIPPAPPFRAAIAVTTEQMRGLVGTYALAPTFKLVVTQEGDGLWLQATSQPKIRLHAATADRWFVREVAAELAFERDAAGRVVAATLHQNGQQLRGAREP